MWRPMGRDCSSYYYKRMRATVCVRFGTVCLGHGTGKLLDALSANHYTQERVSSK